MFARFVKQAAPAFRAPVLSRTFSTNSVPSTSLFVNHINALNLDASADISIPTANRFPRQHDAVVDFTQCVLIPPRPFTEPMEDPDTATPLVDYDSILNRYCYYWN